MNVIDFKQAQQAAGNIESQTVKDVTTQVIPVAAAALNELLAKGSQTIEETVGGALNDLTSERQQFVNDVHGVLDRLNGTKLVMTDGGFELRIPPRVA